MKNFALAKLTWWAGFPVRVMLAMQSYLVFRVSLIAKRGVTAVFSLLMIDEFCIKALFAKIHVSTALTFYIPTNDSVAPNRCTIRHLGTAALQERYAYVLENL